MSTACMIGIEREDWSVEAVYCHSDGYPDGGVGDVLARYFDTRDKAAALIALGNLSTCNGPAVAPEGTWDAQGVTSYHRWRGDALDTTICTQRAVFVEAAQNTTADYVYLFTVNGWRWKSTRGGARWEVLTQIAHA